MAEIEFQQPTPVYVHKRKKRPWAVAAACTFSLLAIFAGVQIHRLITPPKPMASVKIGVLAAFTGGSSSMGYGIMKGVQLAKKQLNATTVEVIQADSQCDPNMAREAMKRLLDQGVIAVIGDGCSSATVAVLPLANNNKVIMISPSASSTALSIPNDYLFRVIPPDNFQAAYIAEAMKARGIKKAAIFYTNEPYGSNMNVAFRDKFESLGGEVVAAAYSEPDDIDLVTQMKLLKNAKPEAVFIAPNSAVSATAAARIARQVGISVPLFGADIFYDKTIITNAPAATDGLTLTSFPTGTATFKERLFNEYHMSEQLYAAPQAYDAFETIYRSLQAGATDGQTIKDMLPTITFDGASARINFDQNGEIVGKDYVYDVLQIKNGDFTKVE